MAKPPDESKRRSGGKPPDKASVKGLKPPKSKPAAPRPARPSSRKSDTAASPSQADKPLEIKDRRALAVKQREIAARVNSDPSLAVMLLINPVLALESFGVKLSKEVAHHVLHRTQHPVALRKRRESLETQLEQELGEPPRPNDPIWLATTLFEKLSLQPLRTAGEAPKYVSPLGAAAIERLQKLRRARTRRYPAQRRLARTASVAVAQWSPAVRRLDLASPAPKLAPVKKPPQEVPLEELYFYKDENATAAALLELGVIQRQSFPFQTPDAFRRIMDGSKPNAFRSWIRSVRLRELPE